METKEYEARLAHDLLKSVSRSFYVTLRLLPGVLRGPVSLAYLLARATDSIADADAAPAAARLELLGAVGELIAGGGDPAGVTERLSGEIIPALDHGGERELLEALPACLEWLAMLPPHQVEAIRAVLRNIVHGQSLDVERFPDGEEVRALADADELVEYTYFVAGSVGEFWTGLCVAELGAKCFSNDVETMKKWGIAFGMGLQLINILRDLPEDMREGRCYLPGNELGGCDTFEGWLERRPGKLTEIFEVWARRCGVFLEEGLLYVENIRPKRLRYGTALPLLLAVRTLALVRKADWEARSRGVKVPRSEVKRIMARAAVASVSKGGLRKMSVDLRK